LGDQLGRAYQVADDIRDVVFAPEALGKPVGQDMALDRPSSARELGLEGAFAEFERLVEATLAAIPACRGAAQFRSLIKCEADRLVPLSLRPERVGALLTLA
jgi:geranylgeranyl diphosphate synthase type II